MSAKIMSDDCQRGSFCNFCSRTGSLLSLAYPIILSQLGSIILGWADTVMVGQYGIQELSAASFVNNIFNLVVLISAKA